MLNSEERMIKARAKLMKGNVGMATMLLKLTLIEDNERCKTMATDGVNIYWNDEFVKSISDEEWSIKKTITGDIPYLIVYYKDSNQIAFILPLRGNSGLTSLNNVLLEADIAKDDLRPFFTTTDKFGDIDSNLKATLFKELRQYLLDSQIMI